MIYYKSILNNIQLFTDGKSPLASDPQSINTNEYSLAMVRLVWFIL